MKNPTLGKDFRSLDLQPAMTFDEIAAELGISKQLAWVIYATAINKLRKQGKRMRLLKELAEAKEG